MEILKIKTKKALLGRYGEKMARRYLRRHGYRIIKKNFVADSHEIDIIAADDLEKQVTFYEVKRQRSEIDLKVLKEKVQRFKEVTGEFNKYVSDLAGLSMEDM